VNFLHFRFSKIRVSPTDGVSSLSPSLVQPFLLSMSSRRVTLSFH
jgi:hypothetical protein